MKSTGKARDELTPGDHACFLYRDDQELIAVARNIWSQCRKEGWKLLYVARVNPRDFIEDIFREEDTFPGKLVHGLRILTSDEPEFHQTFSTVDKATKFISREIETAKKQGFSALCIMREAPPIPSDTHSSQRLVSDMVGIEALLGKKTLLLVCQYQVEKFPAPALQDVLRSHPVAIIGTEVVENLFYIPATDARRYHLPSLEVQHWIKTLLDMKSARTALAESEERFYDLLENANDLIQSVDPEGKFLFVNRAWRETLGYNPDEVEKIALFDIIDPSCIDKCSALFRKVMAGEEQGYVEAVFRSKDGKKVYVEGNVNCRFSGGSPIYTRGIFRDVTHLRQIETESQQMDQAMEILLNMAPHVIFIINPKGAILHANRAAREMVQGAGRDTIRGTPIWDLFIDKNAFRKELEVFGTGNDQSVRWRHRDLDGKEWDVEVRRHHVAHQDSELFVAALARVG